MNGLRLGWSILEMLFLGFFLYFGSSIALALAMLLILIPMISIPVNLYVRAHLQTGFETAVNLRKRDTGIFTLKLENPTLFPVLRVRCRIQSENQLNREKHETDIFTWLPSFKKKQTALSVGSKYCGRLRLSVHEVVLYDCFGVFGIRCRCHSVGYVTVQPDTFDMNVQMIPTPNSIEESDVYSQVRPGSDLTETYQIREYVPGDSPKQIHWKLSGKFDKLIVRDPALPITRNVLIFWERTGDSGNPALIDAQAEVLVTICRNLLEQSVQFTLGWNDTDRNLCILQEIHDMDELIGIIPRILRATGVKEGISGADLLLQTGSHALCAHMVYLAEEPQGGVMELQRYGHVSMLLCGKTPLEGALLFDEVHYREQLLQIEL